MLIQTRRLPAGFIAPTAACAAAFAAAFAVAFAPALAAPDLDAARLAAAPAGATAAARSRRLASSRISRLTLLSIAAARPFGSTLLPRLAWRQRATRSRKRVPALGVAPAACGSTSGRAARSSRCIVSSRAPLKRRTASSARAGLARNACVRTCRTNRSYGTRASHGIACGTSGSKAVPYCTVRQYGPSLQVVAQHSTKGTQPAPSAESSRGASARRVAHA